MWSKRNEAEGLVLCTCFTHTVFRKCGLVCKAASGLTSKDPQGNFGLGTALQVGFRGGPVARPMPRVCWVLLGLQLACHGLSVRTS